MNAKTPRTDALVADVEHQYCAELQPLIDMTEHARQLERELNAAVICAGVASKERGEWDAEREDLVGALERYQALFFGRLGNLEHMGTEEFRAAHLKAYQHAGEVLQTWACVPEDPGVTADEADDIYRGRRRGGL